MKEQLNGKQIQPPQGPPPWLRKKMATSQLANQIFTTLVLIPESQAKEVGALVERSYALAEEFDRQTSIYFQPPVAEAAEQVEAAP